MNHLEQQIRKNLSQVRETTDLMMENLMSVRGEKYADLVQILLMATHTINLHQATMDIGGINGQLRDVFGDMMCKNLYTMISKHASSAGFSVEQLEEAIKDAESMGESITKLRSHAVQSGVDGVDFGGDKDA